MMSVQHWCNSIKSVPVSIVLLKPKPNIAQQKPQHFVFTVVKDSTVPEWMVSFLISMKVLVVSSIPHVDPFIDIFSSMRMNDINYYFYSIFMCLINKFLKLMGFAKSWRYTEEVRDMVTKWAIIGMFHNTHDLNYVVTQFENFWKNCLFKMGEAMNFIINTAHSNMYLINFDVMIFPLRFRMFPLIIANVHINSIKGEVDVLSCEINPSWNSVNHIPIC